MAFWVIIAQIIKVILAVKKYATLLSALQSGHLVEGLIRSFIVGAVTNGLAKSGIPIEKLKDTLDRLDFEEEAATQLNQIVDETAGEFAENGLLTAPDDLLEILRQDFSEYIDRLLGGKAVANGLPPTRNQSTSADPIVLHRGEFEREVIDLEVNGAGMDFAFRRIYRSGATYLGPLGQSWDHAYNLRLHEENDFVLVRLTGELAEDRFVQHPRFGDIEFSYYAPPDGIHDVIVPDGVESFLLRRPKGITFRFEGTDQPNDHRVRRIDDRFGNFLSFEYSPDDHLQRVFVNSTARFVTFAYDDLGRITRIEDHTGRAVVYGYDDLGYLDSVIGPALPDHEPVKFEQYEYNYVGEVRKLVRVVDWEGRIIVENEYESDELSDYFGHVIRQAQNHGESTFFYESIRGEFEPGKRECDVPTLRVWETRRNGHQVEYVFNESGNKLLTRECFVDGCQSREAVTRLRYNADGQLIARLDPDGTLTQYLFSRDHLADSIPWPDVDPVLGDVSMKDRLSFGGLLATVTRGRRVSVSTAPFDPGFWEQGVPSVKLPDHVDDIVMKHRYDRDSQLPVSTSDPRHTISADPLHVESSNPGDPNFDATHPQFLDHQRHLTRQEYGPGPRFELMRTFFPDRTRPSLLDGVETVTGIVEQFTRYDANGRLLESVDTRGYEWFNEYYPFSLDPGLSAKEGFLRRRLIPHLDLALDKGTPEILEIRRNGTWQVFDRFVLSSGALGDAIAISVEGVRFGLYQSSDLTGLVSTNPQVTVIIDGAPQAPWNQSADAVYLVSNLPNGIHSIELGDAIGFPFSIGRIRSHVSVEHEVDDLGRILQETDARNHVTVNAVDVLGRKIRVTKGSIANPASVSFEYDPSGRLISERAEWRDETGESRPELAVVKRYQYDQAGLLLSESIGPEQGGTMRIKRHRYDPDDNLLETIDPLGNRTYFEYDALNRQIRAVRAACSPERSVTTTSYDSAGHVLARQNPRGALDFNGYLSTGGIWRSGIDTRGRIRVKTDPLLHVAVTDYDAMGNPTVVRQFQRRTDNQLEMLSRRETTYDEQGDAIRVTDAVFEGPILTVDPVDAPDIEFFAAINDGHVQNATTENHLDASGNIIAVRSPVGGIQRQRFDGQDRWYDQVDAAGKRIFRVLDGNGNVTRIYTFEPVHDVTSGDLLHHEVFFQEYEYDELNRENARLDSYGNRWQKQYDTLGNQTLSVDPLNNVVRFDHNAFGEKVTVTQERTQTGLGGGAQLSPLVRRLDYDGNGNVIAMIDPLQRRTTFTFDGLDRLIGISFAVDLNAPKEVRTYDRADNVTSITDRNALVLKMQYDLSNRHVRTESQTSGVTPGNELSTRSATFASFKYDAAGNPVAHENDFCKVEIHRDSRGLILSEKTNITNVVGAPQEHNVIQTYDLAGRRVKVVYPSGREVGYAYDLLGRVIAVQNIVGSGDYPGRPSNAAGFDVARYTYVGRRLARADLGNGLTLALRFDGRGHVLERALTDASGTLWRLQQLRDAAGYIRLESAMTRTGARSRKFALDSIYQLAHYRDDGVQWIDPVLLTPPHAPVDLPQLAAGQAFIDAAIGPLALPAEPQSFEYDDLGNRLETDEFGLAPFSSAPNDLNQYIQVNGILWQYDANGNLRSDDVQSFKYDLNNRLQEITDTSTNTEVAIYYRDALGRVVAETTAGGTLFRIFNGPLPLVEIATTGKTEFTVGHRPDAVLHAAFGGEDYWILYDGLTSMRALATGLGNIVAMPLFRPYGAAEDNELTLSPLRFGFASMWYTPGLPYYHSASRSYRTDVGRYFQRDPAGVGDDVNLYSYARNNPINFSDPSGEKVDSTPGTAEQVAGEMQTVLETLASEKGVTVDELDMHDALVYVAMHLKNYRYTWTKGRGFIDMKHALSAAEATDRWYVDDILTLARGVEIEMDQAEKGNPSAFGVEDLVSNKTGTEFEAFLPDKVSELPGAWKKFVTEQLGGSSAPPPLSVINELNKVYNLGYTPVLDPTSKDILVTEDGIRYVSEGRAWIDEERLRMIREGLKKVIHYRIAPIVTRRQAKALQPPVQNLRRNTPSGFPAIRGRPRKH